MNQCCGSGFAWICIICEARSGFASFGKPDPDPHQSEKLDPDLDLECIIVKSRIRIRIKVIVQDLWSPKLGQWSAVNAHSGGAEAQNEAVEVLVDHWSQILIT